MVTVNSHYFKQNTCHGQSTCKKTGLRFHISLRGIFSNSISLREMGNMIRVLSYGLQWCLWPFNILTVEGFSQTGLLRHLTNPSSADSNFGNTKAMRVVFFSEWSKFWCKFEKFSKQLRNREFLFSYISAFELVAVNFH